MRRRIISKTDNTVLMPPSSNRIKYTTSDNKIISVSKISENENIISNTYVENFGGIIELDGILTGMYPRLFYNKVTLTRVTLPNTLNYITYGAFENCKSLEEIILSDNVINIYKQAFTRCINLRKIHIGRSVESLGYEDGSESLEEYTVFSHCSNINEITIDPLNITYSDGSDSEGANVILDKNTKTILVGCKNSIIPTSALIIGYSAFSECIGMVSITIPSNISEIKELAFYECSDLKTIIFESTTPATIPTDSTNAIFSDSLEKILVPHESVDLYKESWPIYADKIFSNALFVNYTTSDGNIITPATNAFGDAQIVSNTYSNGIGIIELDKPCTVLKDSAFKDIITLTSFKIPESVTSIEKSIFFNTGIEEIYIPKNVTTLGENVLRSMYSLKKIVVDSRNTVFDSRDNCNAIIKTSTNTLLSCCIETVIPESVKIIGVRAYQGVQVENFTIPNWITKLENYAFGWCDKLKSIEIPNSVTSIGENAFQNCTELKEVHINDIAAWCGIDFDSDEENPLLYYAKNLYLNGELITELVIPDGINKIKKSAFYNCKSLTSVVIPNSVTSIERFAFEGCSGLTSVEIPNSVTSIEHRVFYRCSSLTSIVIPNSVTSIGNEVFHGCSSLISITIPDTVTSIGSGAFQNCKSLTSIVIPNSVTSIGYNAFYGCSSLTNIEIPNNVTSIGERTFYNCFGLTSVEIPNSVTSIGGYAFEYCKSLTSIVIPNSVTSIGNEAFYGCSSLTSIVIPNSVTSIGSGAFGDTAWYNNQPIGIVYAGKMLYNYKGTMPSNTSIIIEDGTLGIVSHAFSNYHNLTSIVIPNSVTSIGYNAFYGCPSLTSVTIGNSVTSIGNSAFQNCKGLASLIIKAITPPTIGSNAFSNVSKLIPVYVPSESVNTYKSAQYWSEFTNIQEIEE